MVVVDKRACVCIIGEIMEFNRDRGCTLFLPASVSFTSSLCTDKPGNISATDGQHVILMLCLWQRLKVKPRRSCKRQWLGVINQEGLFKNSNPTSWEKTHSKVEFKMY